MTVVTAFLPSLGDKISFMGPYPLVYSLILAATAILLLAGWPAPGHRPYLLLGSALLLGLVLLLAWEKTADTRSPKSLAQGIRSHWQADAIIVGFHYYSQALSFYAEQPLYLFQTRGELEFGLEQQPGSPFYLHWPRQLPELLRQHPNFFVVLHQDNLKFLQNLYSGPITVLEQWKNYLLISKP